MTRRNQMVAGNCQNSMFSLVLTALEVVNQVQTAVTRRLDLISTT